MGADSTSLRGSSIACLCALLMGAACGPGDPAPSNEGSAPAPDAGDEPNCLSVQQMADGSCCGTGMFADVATGQCVPIGPAECRYMHGIYISTTAKVRDNTIYRASGAGIHLWHDASHLAKRTQISNNKLYAFLLLFGMLLHDGMHLLSFA